MKAFPFDRHIVESYARFSQSFSTIKAPDLREAIEREYKEGRFWPDALLSLNPRYEAGPTADDLVNSGDVCSETAQIFPFGSKRLPFYRHQGQAFAKARAGQSFVVNHGDRLGQIPLFFRSDRGCHYPCAEGWRFAEDTGDHRVSDERTR